LGTAADAGVVPFCGRLSDVILRKDLEVRWEARLNHGENIFTEPILTALRPEMATGTSRGVYFFVSVFLSRIGISLFLLSYRIFSEVRSGLG